MQELYTLHTYTRVGYLDTLAASPGTAHWLNHPILNSILAPLGKLVTKRAKGKDVSTQLPSSPAWRIRDACDTNPAPMDQITGWKIPRSSST
jgi:hypothetical protein